MRPVNRGIEDLTSGIENARVREIIVSHGNLEELLRHPREVARKHQEEIREHQHYLNQCEERKWLTKKGKKHMIDFDNGERKKMKQYFNTLDKNKTGVIGVDQLEQLLFSVGLVETREEIKALIDSVDEGKTGKIQFSEFLSMIQNDEGQNQEIVSFFKSVIGERPEKHKKVLNVQDHKDKPVHKTSSVHKELKKIAQTRSSLYLNNDKSINRSSLLLKKSKDDRHSLLQMGKAPEITSKYPYPKGLSFEMVVSHIRRKYMMTALNIGKPSVSDNYTSPKVYAENTIQQIAKGQKVMHALQKMYQRKLIRQIKQNKRSIHQSFKSSQTKTQPSLFKISFNHKLNRVN